MIIVPGEANVTVPANMSAIDNYWLECNKGTEVRVFDTYDWEFKPEFNPSNKGPKVPPSIVQMIGGNSTGGATLKKPKAGWDNPALGPIFLTRNELLPDPPVTTPGGNMTFTSDLPSGSTSSAAQNTAKSNKGAIIGGVVGGICVAAVVVGVLIFFLKRRQKSNQALSTAELQGAELRPELQGNHVYAGPYNTPQELQGYEPQEMGVAPGGHYAPVKPEEQQEAVFVDHISPHSH